MTSLTQFIRDSLIGKEYPEVRPYVELFRERFPEGLLAVVFYGSMLSEATSTETSIPDFFLIVKNYRLFYRLRLHALLNGILPPNFYYLAEKVDRGGKSQTLRCKYNVVSMKDLESAMSGGMKDLHLPGRFTKRIALLYKKDDAVALKVAEAVRTALFALAPHALARVGSPFTLREFGKALLRLSYEGEVRLEKSQEKVDKLYEASQEYYDRIFTMILERWMSDQSFLESAPAKVGESGHRYRVRWSPAERIDRKHVTARLIRRSRLRAVARWPKGILLMENWIDILLDKLERTYGCQIELTPTERRFILIFGWKHFFRLWREGKIR